MTFNAKLIAVTKPVVEGMETCQDLISYCARVSNPSNQMNFETSQKLIDYLIKHKHWSPLEVANCVVEVNCPRDIARQLLRHRSFAFQEFCISKDSLVKTDVGSLAIEDLFEMQVSGEKLPNVKVYDEDCRIFKQVAIKEVFETGEKLVYELRLKSGQKIKSTLEHKFLTKSGFKELRDISVGDFVGVNGIPCYQNKDWLKKAKEDSILSGGGLLQIASFAGASSHTIRKWLRIHQLQFTKQEVAKYTVAWNKGLRTEDQPMYGKLHSETTREQQARSAKSGSDSNLWTGGVDRSFRQEVWDWQYKYRNAVMKAFASTCVECGAKDELELDHVLPVKSCPEKAFDISNLQVLCQQCHSEKSAKEYIESPNFSEVVSITEIGIEQTYDLEVDHFSHNYVANGIVTHNSQRYADVTQLEKSFCIRDLRLQDTKNRQNSIETDDEYLKAVWETKQREILNIVQEHYTWAINAGIAKEVARVILPEGLTMSRLYVNGTIRSWIHYLEVRMEEGVTQLEHVILARLIAEQINTVFKVTK